MSAAARRIPLPLPDGWFQVAYSDELVPGGAVLRLAYFGGEQVAWRGTDGNARVFDAHCPHLGAHLGHGGAVVGDRLRCPFHHWEFDGEGRCVRIPYAKKIPPLARIRAWSVVERNGLVMVWFDKQGRPPRFEIPSVPEFASDEWTDYSRHEWTVRSCAQELAENTVDPAHFRYVHGTAELPTAEARADGPCLHVEMDYPIAAADGRMLQGDIEITTWGFGFGVTRFRGIVDTTVVVTGTPFDEERVHNRLNFMVRRLESEEATEGLGRAFVGEITRQFSEDMPIWENKVHWERPLLCDGDGPIGVLRQWARQWY
jgi:3-ketosteroid 9alpha-monooxygenase subunit A